MAHGKEIAKATAAGLPGQAAADLELVAEVATKVRNAYREGGLATLIAVGKIVIDGMFNGDLEQFKTGAKTHESFRALSKRSDIGMSSTQLWYSVAVLENVRLIGDDESQRLATSHHRLLTHVTDKDSRKKIARKAIEQNLTVRELEAEIRQTHVREPDAPKLGRPALPIAVRQFGELERQVRALNLLDKDAIACVDKGEIPRLIERVRATQDQVDAWLVGLARQLDGVGSSELG